MSLRARFALLVLVLLTGACNLSTDRPRATPLPPAIATAGASKPTATILAPTAGSEVVVGTDVLVWVRASDRMGITRIQLIANDRIVRTVSAGSADGRLNMEETMDYRPVTIGELKLEVVAWRGNVPGDAATVTVSVRANRSQVFATAVLRPEIPVIDPNDPTCRILVQTDVPLNVRSNAGTEYNRIRTLQSGSQVPVIGRLADNSWWQLSLRDGTAGWVAAHEPGVPTERFLSVYGDCTLIPALAPPQATVAPTELPAQNGSTPAPESTHTPAPAVPDVEVVGEPDLVVAGLQGPDSLSLVGEDSPVTGVYELTISNRGLAAAARFSVRLTGVPDTGTIEQVVSGLGPGESIFSSHSLTFREPAIVIIVATVDSGEEIEESDEANNSVRLDVTISRS